MLTKSFFKHFFWLCLSEMLLATFGGPITTASSFIRVPLKHIQITSPFPNPYHYYVGAISLGTPPQAFNFFVDSSAAELAIRAPAALTNALVFPVYDSKKSSTYKKNGTSAAVTTAYSYYLEHVFAKHKTQFGNGFLSTDTLKIGTATIKQQTFIEMTTIGSSMKSFSSFTDGILGLAYPSATPSGATPFFQNMLKQGIIANPIFALTHSNTSDGDFELTLGGMDSTKFKGMPTWTPITEKKFWKFSVSGLAVRYSERNISRVSCNGPTGCQMVINMNEDGIYGSYEVLSRLGPLIGTTSFTQYQGIDCLSFKSAKLPDIGFTIAGKDFFLTPAQYISADTWGYCSNPTSSSYRWTYFFPWTPRDKMNSNSEVWILGTPFLRAVSTVFDFGNNRIGFTPN